jgi:hypothetical protein
LIKLLLCLVLLLVFSLENRLGFNLDIHPGIFLLVLKLTEHIVISLWD